MSRLVAAVRRPRLARSIVLAVCAASAACAVCLSSACIDPKSDYEDWIARTADAQTGQPSQGDAGPVDGALPDGGFEQQYLMACTSDLANGDITKATLFAADITYRPSGTGATGTLTIANQPLKVGASTLSDTVGDPATNSGTVTSDGRSDVTYGASTIPGSANPITGQDVVFTNSTLHFVIGPGTQLCADLSGTITAPFAHTFDPTKNICIFLPTTGPVPDISGDQSLVTCPYP